MGRNCFLAGLYECTGRAVSTPGVGVGGNVDKMLSFTLKFYVMGKALPGELSCTWTGLVVIHSEQLWKPLFPITNHHHQAIVSVALQMHIQ